MGYELKRDLLDRISGREIVVGVVGVGYVGLPLAVEKARAGFKTIGFDINAERVDSVNRGENYIGDVVSEDLAQMVKRGMLCATNDFSLIRKADFIAICVPTPLTVHQQPDISYLQESARTIAPYIKRGDIIVLESTTYPGTTEELLMPVIEEGSGLKCGKDFYLGFSPERVDPGNLIFKTRNTPKVVGAVGGDALEIIAHMYRTVLDGDIFTVSSPAVAEMEKILENMYRNINIALINELAILCNRMKINIWEVVEAAKTKPYGFQAFYPGPGLGGHCIPLDPHFLSWKAREYGFHTSMIEAAATVNDRMPEYCVDRVAGILNGLEKPLSGSKILIVGVAYKQDIGDFRESPAIKMIRLMENKKADVDYYDPFVTRYEDKGRAGESIPELSPEVLSRYDIIVIATEHRGIDYEMIATAGAPVFDTRNALRDYNLPHIERI
ncbi:MAG: nucleotide sugar dehydrogenase [Oscillospiraceae bacterium]|jgi:UDP-N-acetyl-D-glucosamine dehydrogenase|nr:nucleotide sugar dehydrogenase [Oscillospiraceae bacterium]